MRDHWQQPLLFAAALAPALAALPTNDQPAAVRLPGGVRKLGERQVHCEASLLLSEVWPRLYHHDIFHDFCIFHMFCIFALFCYIFYFCVFFLFFHVFYVLHFYFCVFFFTFFMMFSVAIWRRFGVDLA